MFCLKDNLLTVKSRTTEMLFDGCKVVSIRNVQTGEEYIDRENSEGVPAFELLHISGNSYQIGTNPICKISHRKFSDNMMEIQIADWDADVSVKITVDEATGDILV